LYGKQALDTIVEKVGLLCVSIPSNFLLLNPYNSACGNCVIVETETTDKAHRCF
jgi:hypothetical protein